MQPQPRNIPAAPPAPPKASAATASSRSLIRDIASQRSRSTTVLAGRTRTLLTPGSTLGFDTHAHDYNPVIVPNANTQPGGATPNYSNGLYDTDPYGTGYNPLYPEYPVIAGQEPDSVIIGKINGNQGINAYGNSFGVPQYGRKSIDDFYNGTGGNRSPN